MSVAENVKSIFTRAVEIESPSDRAAFVDAACGEDASLHNAVEQLLAAAAEAGSFMRDSGLEGRTAIHPPIAEGPSTVIGPYKLLQQIGEGGMGVVFMAEQTAPIERIVALKIIKPGMDTRQVIARFEAERQALALMDHPNIAKVLDAGATAAGRPYFVMELVKGVPITRYCDDKRLSLRQRLELLLPVCQAVHHAHQKGVIHRDIKPSNVPVTEYDNHAVPKVIDFGVAKATAQKLTERTMFTEFGQVLGTFEYMSPEQAKLNQLDIDTRSDIYSLGVVLYELLTGVTPFEGKRLHGAAFDEMLRIIREEDPPKPSTRITSSESLSSIAANRGAEPARLSRDVRGELDWIVMKCLEKDRNRRYETANGLVRDIERYLHDEPVQACPPSAAYRFGKFARRNKVAFGAAAAGLAMLLLLVAGLATSNRLIAAQRAQADAQRQRAEENLLRARVAVRDIMFDAAMGHGEWSQLPPSLRNKFTEKTVAFYESLLNEESTSPSMQYETAVGYRSLALLHLTSKDYQQAEKFVRRAIAILDRLVSDDPETIEYRQQLAYSQYLLGSALRRSERLAAAETPLRKSAELYEKLIAEKPDVAGYYNELAPCFAALINVLKAQGASAELPKINQRFFKVLAAASELQQSAAGYLDLARAANSHGSSSIAERAARRAVELEPKNYILYSTLSIALTRQGKFDEAIAASREAVRLNPRDQQAVYYLGNAFLEKGILDEAATAFRKSIELKPADSFWSHIKLARALMGQGEIDEAIDAAEQAVRLNPTDRQAHYFLGNALLQRGRLDDAIESYRKAISLKPEDSAWSQLKLGRALRIQGKTEEAEAIERELLAMTSNDARLMNDWAWYLAAAADPKHRNGPRAVELARKATALAPGNGDIWNTLGVAHYRAGEWQSAISALEKSVALHKAADPSDSFFLAMANWQLGNKVEARAWYDKAVAWMDQNKSTDELLRRFREETTELLEVKEEMD
jgi:serine/threonine protein kinase/Flp pilus assembly protein TadD